MVRAYPGSPHGCEALERELPSPCTLRVIRENVGSRPYSARSSRGVSARAHASRRAPVRDARRPRNAPAWQIGKPRERHGELGQRTVLMES